MKIHTGVTVILVTMYIYFNHKFTQPFMHFLDCSRFLMSAVLSLPVYCFDVVYKSDIPQAGASLKVHTAIGVKY